MSTITKLDRTVRLDRYLRKEQRREMQKDTQKIEELIARGERAERDSQVEFPAASRKLLGDLRIRRIVMTLMLKHVTKICRDPSRTGARKEAILDKLGGASA